MKWRGAVDAFGQMVSTTSAINSPLRFAGQYQDNETGYYQNYFRDYNSRTGRYLQSDPIGLAGGVNTYGYVGGNPVNLTDPTGLNPFIRLISICSRNPAACMPWIHPPRPRYDPNAPTEPYYDPIAHELPPGWQNVHRNPPVVRERHVQDALDRLKPKLNPNDPECKDLEERIKNTENEIYNKRFPDMENNPEGLPWRIGPYEKLRETVRGHEKLLNRRLNELEKLKKKYEKKCKESCD